MIYAFPTRLEILCLCNLNLYPFLIIDFHLFTLEYAKRISITYFTAKNKIPMLEHVLDLHQDCFCLCDPGALVMQLLLIYSRLSEAFSLLTFVRLVNLCACEGFSFVGTRILQ